MNRYRIETWEVTTPQNRITEGSNMLLDDAISLWHRLRKRCLDDRNNAPDMAHIVLEGVENPQYQDQDVVWELPLFVSDSDLRFWGGNMREEIIEATERIIKELGE